MRRLVLVTVVAFVLLSLAVLGPASGNKVRRTALKGVSKPTTSGMRVPSARRRNRDHAKLAASINSELSADGAPFSSNGSKKCARWRDRANTSRPAVGGSGQRTPAFSARGLNSGILLATTAPYKTVQYQVMQKFKNSAWSIGLTKELDLDITKGRMGDAPYIRFHRRGGVTVFADVKFSGGVSGMKFHGGMMEMLEENEVVDDDDTANDDHRAAPSEYEEVVPGEYQEHEEEVDAFVELDEEVLGKKVMTSEDLAKALAETEASLKAIPFDGFGGAPKDSTAATVPADNVSASPTQTSMAPEAAAVTQATPDAAAPEGTTTAPDVTATLDGLSRLRSIKQKSKFRNNAKIVSQLWLNGGANAKKGRTCYKTVNINPPSSVGRSNKNSFPAGLWLGRNQPIAMKVDSRGKDMMYEVYLEAMSGSSNGKSWGLGMNARPDLDLSFGRAGTMLKPYSIRFHANKKLITFMGNVHFERSSKHKSFPIPSLLEEDEEVGERSEEVPRDSTIRGHGPDEGEEFQEEADKEPNVQAVPGEGEDEAGYEGEAADQGGGEGEGYAVQGEYSNTPNGATGWVPGPGYSFLQTAEGLEEGLDDLDEDAWQSSITNSLGNVVLDGLLPDATNSADNAADVAMSAAGQRDNGLGGMEGGGLANQESGSRAAAQLGALPVPTNAADELKPTSSPVYPPSTQLQGEARYPDANFYSTDSDASIRVHASRPGGTAMFMLAQAYRDIKTPVWEFGMGSFTDKRAFQVAYTPVTQKGKNPHMTVNTSGDTVFRHDVKFMGKQMNVGTEPEPDRMDQTHFFSNAYPSPKVEAGRKNWAFPFGRGKHSRSVFRIVRFSVSFGNFHKAPAFTIGVASFSSNANTNARVGVTCEEVNSSRAKCQLVSWGRSEVTRVAVEWMAAGQASGIRKYHLGSEWRHRLAYVNQEMKRLVAKTKLFKNREEAVRQGKSSQLSLEAIKTGLLKRVGILRNFVKLLTSNQNEMAAENKSMERFHAAEEAGATDQMGGLTQMREEMEAIIETIGSSNPHFRTKIEELKTLSMASFKWLRGLDEDTLDVLSKVRERVSLRWSIFKRFRYALRNLRFRLKMILMNSINSRKAQDKAMAGATTGATTDAPTDAPTDTLLQVGEQSTPAGVDVADADTNGAPSLEARESQPKQSTDPPPGRKFYYLHPDGRMCPCAGAHASRHAPNGVPANCSCGSLQGPAARVPPAAPAEHAEGRATNITFT